VNGSIPPLPQCLYGMCTDSFTFYCQQAESSFRAVLNREKDKVHVDKLARQISFDTMFRELEGVIFSFILT
jgi:hypothetical protein